MRKSNMVLLGIILPGCFLWVEYIEFHFNAKKKKKEIRLTWYDRKNVQ